MLYIVVLNEKYNSSYLEFVKLKYLPISFLQNHKINPIFYGLSGWNGLKLHHFSIILIVLLNNCYYCETSHHAKYHNVISLKKLSRHTDTPDWLLYLDQWSVEVEKHGKETKPRPQDSEHVYFSNTWTW